MELGQAFHRKRMKLSCGGVFDFDAVSADGTVAATISTSGATTATGKVAVGKLLKIRSDMYFLLLAQVNRRLVILTEQDMFELCNKEAAGGRVPASIEFLLAPIPEELTTKLQEARSAASREVSPGNINAGGAPGRTTY